MPPEKRGSYQDPYHIDTKDLGNLEAPDDQAPENAPDSEDTPVDAYPQPGGLLRNMARFRQNGVGPLPNPDLQADGGQEGDHAEPDHRQAQCLTVGYSLSRPVLGGETFAAPGAERQRNR